MLIIKIYLLIKMFNEILLDGYYSLESEDFIYSYVNVIFYDYIHPNSKKIIHH